MMMKALVRAGVGYTVLTFGAIADEVEAGILSSAPLQPETSWTLCAALRRETAGSPVVQAVLRVARSEVRRLVDQGRWRGTPQYLSDEIEA
jgi:LysR family nitrogen assimilation transcriptional regulator